MKTISKWASVHVYLARVILVFGFVLLFSGSLILGILLYDFGILLPRSMGYLTMLLYFILLIFYSLISSVVLPSWRYKTKFSMHFYAVFAVVLLAALGANKSLVTTNISQSEITFQHNEVEQNSLARLVVLQEQKASPKLLDQLKPSKFKLRFQKRIAKRVKKKLRELSTNQPKDNILFKKVMLSLLLVGILVAGIFGLAALSCNLSCSGYAIWAGVALIGGALLLIAIAVFGIRIITKYGKKRREQVNNVSFVSS